MRTNILRGLCAIAIFGLLLGSYLPAAAAPEAAPAAQRSIRIRAFDNGFGPENVMVTVGTTVTWVNGGRAPHNVVADNGAFESPVLRPGESFSYTFGQEGGYGYKCTIHEDMEGNIEVTAQTEPTAEPTATSVPATATSLPATATTVATATAAETATTVATATSVPATSVPATATSMMTEPSATAMMTEPSATAMMMQPSATAMMMTEPTAMPAEIAAPGLPRTGQPADSLLLWLLVAAMLLLMGSGLLEHR